jgi:hypothetical protein
VDDLDDDGLCVECEDAGVQPTDPDDAGEDLDEEAA